MISLALIQIQDLVAQAITKQAETDMAAVALCMRLIREAASVSIEALDGTF